MPQKRSALLRRAFLHWTPWTDIASRRNFAEFKRLVSETFVENELDRDEASRIVYGAASPSPDVDLEDWNASLDGLTQFLRSMARTFLEDSAMYNSIKHGLGVPSGQTYFGYSPSINDIAAPTVAELSEATTIASGDSVEYPVLEGGPDERVWSITTEWVDTEASIRFVVVAAQVLHAIREFGRRMRLSDSRTSDQIPRSQVEVPWLTGFDWRAFRSGGFAAAKSSFTFLRETGNDQGATEDDGWTS